MTKLTLLPAALAAAICIAPDASAQEVRVWSSGPERERVVFAAAADRPMIGVTTSTESERADTLGLRIDEVREDSPAAKAGLKEGDRLQAVNGVSLRAERFDAGERDYDGVLSRRLQREVAKLKDGEVAELRVYSDGRVRTVRVTPVKASELLGSVRGFTYTTMDEDRAMIGFTIGSTGSARDTLGVFVSAVTSDGPAEKAGIVEGDRIAAINGVSVRVASADAEDPAVGAAKANRLRSEIAKLKAGDVAELTVISAGRSRTVRVTTVKASEMPRSASGLFQLRSMAPEMGELMERLELERGARLRVMPTPPTPPTPPAAPLAPLIRSRITSRIITI